MELSFQTLPMRYLGNPIQGSQTQEQTAEVIVPDSCPDVARIVYTSASVIVRGKECRTGSVLVSGGIRASALCIPEDDSGARTLESYLPFSLRIEHPGVTERTQAVVSAFVRQIDARLIHSRKILIRADLCCTAECLTAEEETLYALSAPPKELQTKRRTYPVSLPKETAEKSFTVTDDLTLPTGKPFASEICCYETVPRITDCKVVGSKAVFKGTLEVNMLYLSGDGVPQDKDAAYDWFQKAQAQGHDYAGFFMDRIERPEPPNVLLSATRLLYHMGKIFQSNAPAPQICGVQIDRKRLAKLRRMRIAAGHKADDHEQEQTNSTMSMGW